MTDSLKRVNDKQWSDFCKNSGFNELNMNLCNRFHEARYIRQEQLMPPILYPHFYNILFNYEGDWDALNKEEKKIEMEKSFRRLEEATLNLEKENEAFEGIKKSD